MKSVDMRRKEIGLERRERTQLKLLEAAARLIGSRSEEKYTIDDFIKEAGVSRGTFYNYYSTRNELLDDLWSRIGHDPFLHIRKACEKIADPAERLTAFARLVLHYAKTNPVWGWLVYSLSSDADSVNEDLISYPRPDLELGHQSGRFQFEHLLGARDMTVGMTRSALRATLAEERHDDYPKEVCLMILRALGLSHEDASDVINRSLPEVDFSAMFKDSRVLNTRT